jgi:transposase InsO family protein
MEVSRSGYYAWRRRVPSRRQLETVRLDIEIKAVYQAHKGRPGSPKIASELRERGIKVSRNRVASRMREMGLKSRTRRKFRVTTNSRHKYPVAANLLQRDFRSDHPNRVWVSDITYVWTREGWLYLTVFIDLFSRSVVGWSVSASLGHEMVVKALKRAVRRRQPPKGLIIHSDRGVQYASSDFRQALNFHGFVQSMSRKGDCWDNAVAESFFKTIKTELIYQNTFFTRDQAKKDIFEYIESYYNGIRKHSTLGYKTPIQYERLKNVA